MYNNSVFFAFDVSHRNSSDITQMFRCINLAMVMKVVIVTIVMNENALL